MISKQSIVRVAEAHANWIGQAKRGVGGYWQIVFCHRLSLGLTANVRRKRSRVVVRIADLK